MIKITDLMGKPLSFMDIEAYKKIINSATIETAFPEIFTINESEETAKSVWVGGGGGGGRGLIPERAGRGALWQRGVDYLGEGTYQSMDANSKKYVYCFANVIVKFDTTSEYET